MRKIPLWKIVGPPRKEGEIRLDVDKVVIVILHLVLVFLVRKLRGRFLRSWKLSALLFNQLFSCFFGQIIRERIILPIRQNACTNIGGTVYSVIFWILHFRCIIDWSMSFWAIHSGLYHRHLVDGMDAAILTSLLRPMFTVT